MVTCDSYDFLAEIPVKSWSLCRLSSQFGIVDTQLSRDAPAAKFMLGHGARHGFQRCWETNKPGKNQHCQQIHHQIRWGVQRLLCCFDWMVKASSSQLVIAAEMALLSRKAVDKTVWGFFHVIFELKGLSVTWTILICKVSVSPKWNELFSDSWHDYRHTYHSNTLDNSKLLHIPSISP